MGFDDLDKWLTSPRDFANGTKMSFAGLSSGQDRAQCHCLSECAGIEPAAAPAADAAPAAAAGAPAAGAAAAPAGIEAKLATADPAKGEKVFAKCMVCHTVDQGQPNGLGPNLSASWATRSLKAGASPSPPRSRRSAAPGASTSSTSG